MGDFMHDNQMHICSENKTSPTALLKDGLPGWIRLQLLQLLLQLHLHLHQFIILLHRDIAESENIYLSAVMS